MESQNRHIYTIILYKEAWKPEAWPTPLIRIACAYVHDQNGWIGLDRDGGLLAVYNMIAVLSGDCPFRHL